MLQNAYFLAKIGADTAENEQHFAEILPVGPQSKSWSSAESTDSGVEAIASSGISDSVEGLRVSNEAVLERRHTVLLNRTKLDLTPS